MNATRGNKKTRAPTPGVSKRAGAGGSVTLKEDPKDKDKSKIEQTAKVIFVCLCLGGCLTQVLLVIVHYFDFPTSTLVTLKETETLTLPGVTLCNSNSFRMDKLLSYNGAFREKWTDLMQRFNISEEESSPKGKVDESRNLSIAKEKLIDPEIRHLMKQPIVEQVTRGPRSEDLLDMNEFKCASDDKVVDKNKTCNSMIDPITTSQEIGNCFTLFHGSRKKHVDTLLIAPGYSEAPVFSGNGTDSVKVEESQQPFQPNEVLRFKVNFNPEQYTNINDPVFGTITIHDPTVAPDTRKRRYRIIPGQYYEFYITEQISKLLEGPYTTDCYNYKGHNMEQYDNDDDVHPYLDAPLSRGDCMTGCLVKGSLYSSECNCWPPELPFIDGFENRTTKGKKKLLFRDITPCDWTNMTSDGKFANASHAFEMCFARHEKRCKKLCKKDCLITNFLVNVQTFDWPSKERINHSSNGTSAQFKKWKECCSIVSIRYWRADTILHKHEEKLKFIEMFSSVGGLIAMWSSFSILGAYDTCRSFYKFFVTHLSARREQKEKEKIFERKIFCPSDNRRREVNVQSHTFSNKLPVVTD